MAYTPKEESWTDTRPDDRPSTYFKMEEGDNQVRILSNPVKCWEHWVPVRGEQKNYQRKVICPGETICPVCLMLGGNTEDKRAKRQKWIFKVIDRTPDSIVNGMVKTLTVPWTPARKIKTLAGYCVSGRIKGPNGEQLTLRMFDIVITRTDIPNRPTAYDVMHLPSDTLTEEQKARGRATVAKADHMKEATPHTPEQIEDILAGRDTRQQEIERNNTLAADDGMGLDGGYDAQPPVEEAGAVSEELPVGAASVVEDPLAGEVYAEELSPPPAPRPAARPPAQAQRPPAARPPAQAQRPPAQAQRPPAQAQRPPAQAQRPPAGRPATPATSDPFSDLGSLGLGDDVEV